MWWIIGCITLLGLLTGVYSCLKSNKICGVLQLLLVAICPIITIMFCSLKKVRAFGGKDWEFLVHSATIDGDIIPWIILVLFVVELGLILRTIFSALKKCKKEISLLKITIFILLLIFLASLILPLVFKYEDVNSEVAMGDLLSYSGSVLSALGATVLGIIALVLDKKNEDKNRLLEWRPQVDIIRIEVEKSIQTGDLPRNVLILNKESLDRNADLSYRIFNITCRNNHGLEPEYIRVSNVSNSIYYDNGHRRGPSFAKHCPLLNNKEFEYDNCKKIVPISEEYVKINSSYNMEFSFSVAIEYDDCDIDFVEDINPSITKKKYGLSLSLRFKNHLNLYEEGVFIGLSTENDEICSKYRNYFDKEK